MKVKFEQTEPSAIRRELQIEVEAEPVAKQIAAVVADVSRTARIPGFRAGKIPKPLIRKRYASEIENQVLERLVPHALQHALEESGLRPLVQPVIRDVSLVDGEPFRFTAAFEIRPVIKPVNYKGVPIQTPDAAVSDRHIAAELEALRERQAHYDPIPARPVEAGDFVYVDISNDADGEGKRTTQTGVLIEVGAAEYHADFARNLTGMQPGESKQFEVTYGSDDPDPRAQGKTVNYHVSLKEVKRKVLPELDDEFAQDVGEFASLGALRDRIRERLEARVAREIRTAQENQLSAALVKDLAIEVPNSLVERDLDDSLQAQARSLTMRGVDLRATPIDWRQVRAGMRDGAIERVKWELLLEAIAAEEKIEPSAEDVQERIERIAAEAEKSPEWVRSKIEKDDRMEELTRSLKLQTTVDFLLRNAKIDRR